jgi:fucose permease
MTLYQKMLVFYAIMGVICAVISWFLTKESWVIRLLAALLIGATWPFSFPWRCSSRCFNLPAADDRKGWQR